jgi:AraC-like DNA-binding protein
MVEPSFRIVLPSASVTTGSSPDDGTPWRKRLACTFGHWAIVLMRRAGSGRLVHAGHAYEVGNDALMCFPPGYMDIELGPGYRVRHISFEERAGSEVWRPFVIPMMRRLTPNEADWWDDRLARVAERVDEGLFSDDDLRELKATFKESVWEEVPASAKRIAMDVISAVQQDLASIRNLDALASRFGYTRNHISDVMRDTTGASLGRWVNGMRMARAREVLAATDLAIADVGVLVGIDDPAYFSRAFRRYHGVAPQHWRIAHRPDDERRALIVADNEPPTTAIPATAVA